MSCIQVCRPHTICWHWGMSLPHGSWLVHCQLVLQGHVQYVWGSFFHEKLLLFLWTKLDDVFPSHTRYCWDWPMVPSWSLGMGLVMLVATCYLFFIFIWGCVWSFVHHLIVCSFYLSLVSFSLFGSRVSCPGGWSTLCGLSGSSSFSVHVISGYWWGSLVLILIPGYLSG